MRFSVHARSAWPGVHVGWREARAHRMMAGNAACREEPMKLITIAASALALVTFCGEAREAAAAVRDRAKWPA